MNKTIRLLERTYLFILVTIFLLIVFTPYIIHTGFTMFEEQLVEVFIILLLFTVGYAVLFLYRKETTRNLKNINRLTKEKGDLENRITEAFKYIGSVNIQIQEIKAVFSDAQKFPENKKDFGYTLHFLADRTLSMVNAGWVLFRIIDTKNLDSLGEYRKTRGNSVLPHYKISNRTLLSNEKIKGFTVVGSGYENFYIKTFCIIPKVELSSDNEVFIKAIVNQLEMLFLIFTSIYYRDSHYNMRHMSN